jgi:uncharacterized protein (TIGR00269 family)
VRCKCGNKAVTRIRYLRKAFCRDCFFTWVEGRFLKKLIRKGEKIGVAVSGGKDSLTCLYLIKKFFGKKNEIFSITIDEGIKGYRKYTIRKVKEYCEDWKVPYYIFSFKEEFGITLDRIFKKFRKPCSYCGVLRRYLLNKKARELGARKLAIAHNLDDEVQSILMNLFRKDLLSLVRISEVPGILRHSKFVPRVKPMRLISEKEVMTYFLLHNLETAWKSCPYSRFAFREVVRRELNKLEEKNPGVKLKLLQRFDSLIPKLRKKFEIREGIKECELCEEPAKKETCKTCEILRRIKKTGVIDYSEE